MRQIRATGTVQALRAHTVQVPRIADQSGRVVLVTLIANGSKIKKGDVLAEFDTTQQEDKARDARAKYDDFAHQVEQRRAQSKADVEKRLSDLMKAEADLAKAQIQLRKGPLLSEIDRLKNETKADDATARVASLRKSNGFRDQADTAALRILELKRDRQRVALDRAESNLNKLTLKAPLDGMVVHENVWRGGSMGPAQEGDQLFGGQPLVKIFDPSEMEVVAQVGETDGSILVEGARAKVVLDAYPDLTFEARFHSSGPVAVAAIGTPIKTFTARFRLEQRDPHLLPDLSAAVIVQADADLTPRKR